jgi:phosphoribosylaminoimidazolecarboxamide formyltransferase/IMP cyclohydrolase
MSINVVEKIDDLIFIKHVLISVSDKTDLDRFIPRLIKINPKIVIFSTGGTFERLKEIMGDNGSGQLIQVSDYTGQPETQGGLVKTLDFKIYLGLLTETYNDLHKKDLERTKSVPIDMTVVNLYPFKETISKKNITPENARGNIDKITLKLRYRLAQKAFKHTADYDCMISEYLNNTLYSDVKTCYNF